MKADCDILYIDLPPQAAFVRLNFCQLYICSLAGVSVKDKRMVSQLQTTCQLNVHARLFEHDVSSVVTHDAVARWEGRGFPSMHNINVPPFLSEILISHD